MPDSRRRDPIVPAEVLFPEGVDFYSLQKRPDVPGLQLKDLWEDGESFTVEQLEQASRQGRDLTRGE
jgi:hypothetical protein